MNELKEVGPAFLQMAHQIVWCSAATVDAKALTYKILASCPIEVVGDAEVTARARIAGPKVRAFVVDLLRSFHALDSP